MEWLKELIFTDVNSVAHIVLIYAAVIAIGIPLGRVKIFGVSFGVALVLFVGIAFGQCGIRVNADVLQFAKEFGMILFVFSIGLQVGPGFFASFKRGGLLMNGLALAAVILSVLMTIGFHFITKIPMYTMAGVLSGAVTNTPGLGAAQQAFAEIVKTNPSATAELVAQAGVAVPADATAAQIAEASAELAGTIGQGYACAYPLGVLSIIISMLIVRAVFKISYEKETEALKATDPTGGDNSTAVTLEITNAAIAGKTISEVVPLLGRRCVISRHRRGEELPTLAHGDTQLGVGDRILVISAKEDAEAIAAFFGNVVKWGIEDWENFNRAVVRRRIIVTKDSVNGRALGRLDVYTTMGVTFTRINRAGVVLIASPTLRLQVGDRVNVVGPEHAVDEVEKMLGNELKELDRPHLVSIFLGIAVGVIFGSIPIALPGLSQPMKLGIAGGPLIIAILIGCWGYKSHLVTYTPIAANLMLREVGLVLFLASVGIGAGNGFLQSVMNDGYWWTLIGLSVTLVPLLAVGFVARGVFKMNYFSIIGIIAGIGTNPPAIAYASNVAGNEAPNVAYATIYPLTMFLRVLTPQLLILVFCT